MADQYTRALVMGRYRTDALVITRYPLLAVGTTLTAAGMTTGVYAFRALGANEIQIVAANDIATEFWLVGISLGTLSASSIFVVRIGSGTVASMVRRADFQVAAVVVTAVGVYAVVQVNSPIPLYFAANSRIVGDMASNNAAADDTATCAVLIAA